MGDSQIHFTSPIDSVTTCMQQYFADIGVETRAKAGRVKGRIAPP